MSDVSHSVCKFQAKRIFNPVQKRALDQSSSNLLHVTLVSMKAFSGKTFRYVGQRACLILVFPISVAAVQPLAPAWTAAQTSQLAVAKTCVGQEYSRPSGELKDRIRDAAEIVRALPQAGEGPAEISDDRAADIYSVAKGLLLTSMPDPERPLDGGKPFLTCQSDPKAAVALLTFLAADGPANRRGPDNTFYWLGMAYRRGVGVPQDMSRARSLFLTARILGLTQLTVEDWGTRPADTLTALLSRPDNRAMLEKAAAAGRDEAQLLLANLLLSSDKVRARSLLLSSAAGWNIPAIRRFADLEMQGSFGKPDYLNVVKQLASIAHIRIDDYNSMLGAARSFNQGEIAELGRVVTVADIGGERLLAQLRAAEVDHIRGRVATRGLVAPDGHIIFVEVPDSGTRQFKMARQTLRIFRPENLRPIAPHRVDGKPAFAWVDLPTVNWR